MATEVPEQVRRFVWTREEYYRLAEEGFFDGRHVQLINGEIIEMAPQKHRHTWTLTKIRRFLESVFQEGYWVREEKPLRLGPRSEPEPDVAVVEGNSDHFIDHPTSALLVVEVSDATLMLDRRKVYLYASGRIPEYWLVNVREKNVTVHRNPQEDLSAPMQASYGDVVTLTSGQYLTPLDRPNAKLAVGELFQ